MIPKARNVKPDTNLTVSVDTNVLSHAPIKIHMPAPMVRAEKLPVKTQRALWRAANASAVRNDLSPSPARATVANAVVKPATCHLLQDNETNLTDFSFDHRPVRAPAYF